MMKKFSFLKILVLGQSCLELGNVKQLLNLLSADNFLRWVEFLIFWYFLGTKIPHGHNILQKTSVLDKRSILPPDLAP